MRRTQPASPAVRGPGPMPQTRTGTKLTPKRLYSHGQIPGHEEEVSTPLVFHPQLKLMDASTVTFLPADDADCSERALHCGPQHFSNEAFCAVSVFDFLSFYPRAGACAIPDWGKPRGSVCVLDICCWSGRQQTSQPLKSLSFGGIKYFEVRHCMCLDHLRGLRKNPGDVTRVYARACILETLSDSVSLSKCP